MSGRKPRKNARMEEEDGSSGSEFDSDAMEEEETSNKNEEIQVDFEGRNPAGSDFHGIRQLLQQLFLKAHINLSQLTDMIIAQSNIGSVIIQSEPDDQDEDDDDEDEMMEDNTVFGITTVINISHKKEVECIKQLRSHILDKATSSGDSKSLQILKEVLENTENCVGILLNERFVNIPAQISVPLFETLYKEIKEASEKKTKYKFSHILSIIKFHRLEAEGKKPSEDFYSNQEEEIICKDAIVSFEYSVKSEADTGVSGDWVEDDSGLTPYRKIILLDANKFVSLSETVKNFLSE